MANAAVKRIRAQSTLESSIVFVTVVLFLMGGIAVWKKINDDMVKQVNTFKESRQSRSNQKMKKGVFIRCQSGQVAPLLIIVIAALLIATISLVNVGKTGSYRINTGNAADAGALAGVSVLASAQNAIADSNAGKGGFNTGMLAAGGGISLMDAYLTFVGLFGLPLPLETEKFKYNTYVTYSAALLYNYLNLLYVGYRGMQNAQAEAHQVAFSNLQIEEAEKVKEGGLSPLKSDFSKWIESQDFKGDSFTYSWRQYSYSTEQGKEVQETQDNWVRTDVEKPSANALVPIPMPAAPLFSFYWKIISPCVDPSSCALCAKQTAEYWAKYAEINGAESLATKAKTEGIIQMSIGGTDLITVSTPSSIPAIQLKTTAGLPLVQAFATSPPACDGIAWMTVFYWVPVPFIAYLLPEEVSIKVETTRYEPTSDLGFYQSGAGEVKSGAKATTYGGNVFKPHSYKIKLEDTW